MSAPAPLKVDLDALAVEVGEAVWQRGRAYAGEGRIEVLATSPGKVTAQAHGTETYTTEIRCDGGPLERLGRSERRQHQCLVPVGHHDQLR